MVFPLPFSRSSLLVFASVCVCVFFFFSFKLASTISWTHDCLLLILWSSCSMLFGSPLVKAKRTETQHRTKQNAQCRKCSMFFASFFFFLVPMDPPELDSDNFSGNFFECLAAGEKFLRISLHSRYGFCTLVSSTLEDSCFCPSEAEAVFKLALADASSKGYRPRWLLCRPSIGPGRFIFIPSWARGCFLSFAWLTAKKSTRRIFFVVRIRVFQ